MPGSLAVHASRSALQVLGTGRGSVHRQHRYQPTEKLEGKHIRLLLNSKHISQGQLSHAEEIYVAILQPLFMICFAYSDQLASLLPVLYYSINITTIETRRGSVYGLHNINHQTISDKQTKNAREMPRDPSGTLEGFSR